MSYIDNAKRKEERTSIDIIRVTDEKKHIIEIVKPFTFQNIRQI